MKKSFSYLYVMFLVLFTCLLIVGCDRGTNESDTGYKRPSDRYFHNMVYDSTNAQFILFGGISSFGNTLNDTWIYKNGEWSEIKTEISPPPRYGFSFAFDPARNKTILFGGRDHENLYDDTWEFDGISWNLINATQSPSPRMTSAMAYSSFLEMIILYSGNVAGEPTSDTWGYDGNGWHLLSINKLSPPPSMWSHIVKSNGGNDLILLSQLQEQLYTYQQTQWLDNAGVLPKIPLPGFANVASDGQTLYYLYTSNTQDVIEVWKYDFSNWRMINVDYSPQSRQFYTFTYDSVKDRYVIFGGLTRDGKALNDLWEFDGSVWKEIT